MDMRHHGIFLPVLITLSLAFASAPLMAQVYKTVDEHGNVTYTDRPPQEGASPVDLPPLSVVEAPTYEKREPAKEEEGAENGDEAESKGMSLRHLRKNYSDFRIVAPLQEESIWHPQDIITVAWNARYQLQEGMKVTVYVDGVEQSSGTEQIVPVSGLERGEHTVTAELKDRRNRSIATADPVTFFVRRPSVYTNARPPGTPRGGG